MTVSAEMDRSGMSVICVGSTVVSPWPMMMPRLSISLPSPSAVIDAGMTKPSSVSDSVIVPLASFCSRPTWPALSAPLPLDKPIEVPASVADPAFSRVAPSTDRAAPPAPAANPPCVNSVPASSTPPSSVVKPVTVSVYAW
jgi:hypothetical protein